ncbi:MAG: glycosyltransferase family 4 protein [bacterium]
MEVIPGGVDAERFKPVADRRALRRSLGLPTEGLLLLTVRRLIARMGLKNLVDAMPMVLEREPHACLLVGGKGYLRESLRERVAQLGIESGVRLVGFIDEALLPKYYAASDLFVLPTVSLEGFGMVTLEALSSGTPVLGSSAGATPEILRRLDTRLLLEGTEPEHLAGAILRFARMDGREDLRRRCRAFVEENYRWDEVVLRLEKTMEEMVSCGEL